MAEQPDPFAPAKDHAEQLQSARVRARSDAIRHAEDMLYRRFPIVGLAENNAQRRVALLESRRAELIAQQQEAVAAARRTATSADRRRDATLAALGRLGVPHDELEIAPLDRPVAALRRVGLPVALGLLAGVVAFVLGRAPLVVTIVVLVVAGAVWAIAEATAEESVESPELTKLRRERLVAEAASLEAAEAAGAASAALIALEARARALARGERALAEQTVAVYTTELTSAIPPGALADRAQFLQQRKPAVDLPEWAREPA